MRGDQVDRRFADKHGGKGIFANPGGKIKVSAQILAWLMIILFAVAGIGTMINRNVVLGFLTIGLGFLLAWISMLTLYAFGELVQNSDIQTNLAIKADQQQSRQQHRRQQSWREVSEQEQSLQG